MAQKSLEKVLAALRPENITYEIRVLPITVAALVTTGRIERKLGDLGTTHRIITPGLCAADLDGLSRQLGVPVERGPKELKDLPVFFGKGPQEPDLSKYRVRIFAEIVDAPELSTPMKYWHELPNK